MPLVTKFFVKIADFSNIRKVIPQGRYYVCGREMPYTKESIDNRIEGV